MPVPYVIPPAGVSAAVFWTSTVFVDPALPPVIRADQIDPATGEFLSVLVEADPVDAAFLEAWRLTDSSGAAVVNQGQRFTRIKKNTSRTPRELADEARRISKWFVDEGHIDLRQVVTEAPDTGEQGNVYVEYKNKRSGSTGTIGR